MSAFVPMDVIIEILCRLPVKTLLRFTSVCKTWYSLILNPSFISKHLNQSNLDPGDIKNRLILLTQLEIKSGTNRFALHFDNDSFGKYAELGGPFDRADDYFRIVNTCNGLVLLTDGRFSFTETLIIWNPCVKRSLTLPKPIFRTQGSTVRCFGFDSVNNDYKVVQFQSYGCPPEVEIYTLRTGVWKKVCISPNNRIFNYYIPPVWVNGHAHWVCRALTENGNLCNWLLGFDFSAEVFSDVMMPEILAVTVVFKLALFLWDKSLALVEYESPRFRHSKYCWIWRMNEYNVVESWSRLFKIDTMLMTVKSLQRTNEVIMYCREKGLIVYHPNTQKIEALGIPVTHQSIDVYSFVESLVLIEGKQSFTF